MNKTYRTRTAMWVTPRITFIDTGRWWVDSPDYAVSELARISAALDSMAAGELTSLTLSSKHAMTWCHPKLSARNINIDFGPGVPLPLIRAATARFKASRDTGAMELPPAVDK
jgi:hypothetical protein